MPNHVTHKITFDSQFADLVFGAVLINGHFDFNALVPSPLSVYRGDLSKDDEQDFKVNWYTWNREHWGTKWNCYADSTKVDGEMATIKFDTAWSIPYPIIAAFANRFQIPFKHTYFDEGHNFWGIEIWSVEERQEQKIAFRKGKSYKRDDEMRELCIDLKGYDPSVEDVEETV